MACPPGHVGPSGALGQDSGLHVVAPQERADGSTEAGVADDDEMVRACGELAS